jgi:hypothetical protein
MLRRISVGAVVAATLVCLSPDLSACGDKFLRAGRSARFRRYAAVHPSSILLYAPAPAWTSKGVKEFEVMLQRAGHAPVTLRNAAGFAEALASRKFDLVIALYSDAVVIRTQLASTPAGPVLLPVLYRPSPEVAIEAASAYQSVIRVDKMDKFQALETIDELLSRTPKHSTRVSGN